MKRKFFAIAFATAALVAATSPAKAFVSSLNEELAFLDTRIATIIGRMEIFRKWRRLHPELDITSNRLRSSEDICESLSRINSSAADIHAASEAAKLDVKIDWRVFRLKTLLATLPSPCTAEGTYVDEILENRKQYSRTNEDLFAKLKEIESLTEELIDQLER